MRNLINLLEEKKDMIKGLERQLREVMLFDKDINEAHQRVENAHKHYLDKIFDLNQRERDLQLREEEIQRKDANLTHRDDLLDDRELVIKMHTDMLGNQREVCERTRGTILQ